MRKAISTILATPLLLASLTTARAAEPEKLTLACQGTMTNLGALRASGGTSEGAPILRGHYRGKDS
jgi:hypothetical protein